MSTDPTSPDFDPLLALYSSEDPPFVEGVKVYDNVAVFEANVNRSEKNEKAKASEASDRRVRTLSTCFFVSSGIRTSIYNRTLLSRKLHCFLTCVSFIYTFCCFTFHNDKNKHWVYHFTRDDIFQATGQSSFYTWRRFSGNRTIIVLHVTTFFRQQANHREAAKAFHKTRSFCWRRAIAICQSCTKWWKRGSSWIGWKTKLLMTKKKRKVLVPVVILILW